MSHNGITLCCRIGFIQGQTGEPGDEGMKGEIGVKGAKGEKGARGNRGPPGPQGPVGSDGMPGEVGLSGPDVSGIHVSPILPPRGTYCHKKLTRPYKNV